MHEANLKRLMLYSYLQPNRNRYREPMKKTLLLLLLLPLYLSADLNTTLCRMTDTIREGSHTFHKRATYRYHRFLYGIDSYLSDHDDLNASSYRTIRKSRLLIVASLRDNTRFNLHLRGKITLPRTKNRVDLLFSQDDRQELDNQRAVSQHDDVVRDKKLHVGLRYYFWRERRSSAYAKLNLRLAPPFGPYLKLGTQKSHVSENFWETTWENALYYYINGGRTSASTALSLFKPLNNIYWIGQGNRLYWKGDERLFLTNTLLFYHIFDLNNRMIYKAALTTSYEKQTRFRQESFAFSTGYFHRFDKWYFAEVIPKFRKSQSKHYKNEYLITLNLGMLLGR